MRLKPVGLVQRSAASWRRFCFHPSEQSELSQWLCYDDSSINVVVFIIIIVIIGVSTVNSLLEHSHHKDVTSPCHPSPCDVTEICVVVRRHQRHRCSSSRDCRRFTCKPGIYLFTYLFLDQELIKQGTKPNIHVDLPVQMFQ